MIAGLIGISALVLDVGAWYREHRRLQSVADAAALAGAHRLPYDADGAAQLAYEYAMKNGGPLPQVSFTDAATIAVSVSRETPGVLARIIGSGLDSVGVSAGARASALLPSRASGAVPLIVSSSQPNLSACGGAPCFGSLYTTSLPVNDDATAGGGQMGLVDLRSDGDGSVTADQIAGWVRSGLSDPMDPERYYTAAGSCKFSNQNFHAALDEKVATQTPLLFPVYDAGRTDTTSNPPRYYIVGWSAFVIVDYRLNGCGNKNDFIRGYFVNKIIQGQADPESSGYDFGIRVIALVA